MGTTWATDSATGFDLVQDPFLLSGRESGRVLVLGHRGAPVRGIRENSVEAVTEALHQGADGVEVDVWLTADGRLVCTHDLGPTGHESLATLTEVLAAAQDPAGVRVVVEAKPVADATLALATADALADVLAAAGGSAEIIVSSFDPALLGMIRRACRDLPVRTALLGRKADAASAIVRRAHEDDHDEVHLPLIAVRRAPEVVEEARELGLSVSLWTVNSRPDLRWAAELGVDAVITDEVLVAWSELDLAAQRAEGLALAA
jgi:glycerophosphoryl diester phosphodiesterase